MPAPLILVHSSDGKQYRVKPWHAVSAVNTGAAAVAIKAAVASKKLFLRGILLANKTAGEYPVVELEDSDATNLAIMTTNERVATSPSTFEKEWPKDCMLETDSGKGLQFALQSATGDVYATAWGYVEA